MKGCLGCNACRYGKPCIQKDSFNTIVPKIRNADCIAEEDPNPPLGRYESYPVKDCALLMTSADNFFWTFEQAVSYYKFEDSSSFANSHENFLKLMELKGYEIAMYCALWIAAFVIS